MPGQSDYKKYLDFAKVNVLISLAPAEKQATVRAIFDHIPKNWDHTLNEDTMGENWGIAKARFWMVGHER